MKKYYKKKKNFNTKNVMEKKLYKIQKLRKIFLNKIQNLHNFILYINVI